MHYNYLRDEFRCLMTLWTYIYMSQVSGRLGGGGGGERGTRVQFSTLYFLLNMSRCSEKCSVRSISKINIPANVSTGSPSCIKPQWSSQSGIERCSAPLAFSGGPLGKVGAPPMSPHNWLDFSSLEPS